MEDILNKLRLNDSRNITSNNAGPKVKEDTNLEKLVANLSEQNTTLKKQGRELKDEPRSTIQKLSDNSSSSGRYTDSYAVVSSSGSEQAGRYDIAEMMRIKQELQAAKSVITRQEQELAETRNLKHTMDQAIGASEADFAHHDISEQTIGHLQSAFNASARPFTSKTTGWRGQDGARSDSDFSGSINPRDWNPAMGGYSNMNSILASQRAQQYASAYGQSAMDMNPLAAQRSLSGSSSSLGYDPRFAKDLAMYGVQSMGTRNSRHRTNSTLSGQLSLGHLGGIGDSGMSPPLSPLGLEDQYNLAQRSVGLQSSPVTPSFPPSAGQPWSLAVSCLHPIRTKLTSPATSARQSNLCHSSRADELSPSSGQVCIV